MIRYDQRCTRLGHALNRSEGGRAASAQGPRRRPVPGLEVLIGLSALALALGSCVDTTLPDLSGELGSGPTDGRYCSTEEIDAFEPKTLRIDVIDVGQGDSIFVRTPYDENEEVESFHVLIDAGPSGNVSGSSPGGATVVDYLASHGHDVGRSLQALVVTHGHEDHYGGISAVAAAFPVLRYIDPGFIPPGNQFGSVRQGVTNGVTQNNGVVDAPAGDALGVAPTDVDIFGPVVTARMLWSAKTPPSGNTTSPDGTDINNTSVVLSIGYGGRRVLLMGDAEQEVEQALLDSGVDVMADILKVGHHGSTTASSPAFLASVFARVSPESSFAIISSGRRSFSGTTLPEPATVEALNAILPDYRVLSTENRDEAKSVGEEHGDDHIVITITEDGQVDVCYGI